MQVSLLPQAVSFHLWPAIEAMLKPAGEGFDPDTDLVWVIFENGTLYGAATTRLRDDHVAEVQMIGGARFKDWMAPLDEILTDWAGTVGATKILACGRKGWARFNRAFGWVASGQDGDQIMFEKVL